MDNKHLTNVELMILEDRLIRKAPEYKADIEWLINSYFHLLMEHRYGKEDYDNAHN